MNNQVISINKKNISLLLCYMIVTCIHASRPTGDEGLRIIENLGDTPWLFRKIDHSPKSIPLTQTAIQTGSTYPIILETILEEPYSINNISLCLDSKEAHTISCKIDYLDVDANNWITAFDKTQEKTLLTQTISEAFQSVSQTFGMSKTIENMSLELPLSIRTKKVRITIECIRGKEGTLLPWEGARIELFEKNNKNDAHYYLSNFDDSTWEEVGIPHCYNDMDTYLNISAVENTMWRGEVCYRKHLKVSNALKGKRIFLEFESVNIAASVYVNGIFQHGNTKIPQPEEVTHVGCFLPFVIDITDAVRFGGENLIAVRVSNANKSFFTYPGFGDFDGCGLGFGGIVAPVKMHVLNSVHIPLNTISSENDWGTYIATTAANKETATLRILTHIQNKSDKAPTVKLQTTIFDPQGKVVDQKQYETFIDISSNAVIDHTIQLKSPNLWFPNNSPYGTPALYTAESKLLENGRVIDSTVTRFGIRVITWDGDYCYVNGKKHILRGFGYRNTYPALGSAIPASLYWKDAQIMADCGANTLRVGHAPATREFMNACDEYGLMLLQNSGDTEWSLRGSIAVEYKREYDRNMIISMRNHPSIIVWESNNGLARPLSKEELIYAPSETHQLAMKYDSLQPRLIHNRDCYPDSSLWDYTKPIMIGYTNRYEKVEGSPTLNTEVYGTNWSQKPSYCIPRYDYTNEKVFSNWYVENYLSDLENKACGWIDWMLTETQGEGYTIYLDGNKNQKSLGSSAMDGNRFPKLKYNIYKKALWIDYATSPGVILQSNWNLAMDSLHVIDAWSNCPEVELFVNQKSYGIQKTDERTKRCIWTHVRAEKGILRAVGLDQSRSTVCEDIRIRTGTPHAIQLSVEPILRGKNEITFSPKANGSDVAIITAKVVDRDGNICLLADNLLTFEVEGEGSYRGSYNFLVTPNQSLSYHAPGDKKLSAEGGLMRVVIRSTFKAGKVFVRCNSIGLASGNVSYQTQLVQKRENYKFK